MRVFQEDIIMNSIFQKYTIIKINWVGIARNRDQIRNYEYCIILKAKRAKKPPLLSTAVKLWKMNRKWKEAEVRKNPWFFWLDSCKFPENVISEKVVSIGEKFVESSIIEERKNREIWFNVFDLKFRKEMDMVRKSSSKSAFSSEQVVQRNEDLFNN